jgi:hypothetical protein
MPPDNPACGDGKDLLTPGILSHGRALGRLFESGMKVEGTAEVLSNALGRRFLCQGPPPQARLGIAEVAAIAHA